MTLGKIQRDQGSSSPIVGGMGDIRRMALNQTSLSHTLKSSFLGSHYDKSSLFGVYIRAPDFLKLLFQDGQRMLNRDHVLGPTEGLVYHPISLRAPNS